MTTIRQHIESIISDHEADALGDECIVCDGYYDWPCPTRLHADAALELVSEGDNEHQE